MSAAPAVSFHQVSVKLGSHLALQEVSFEIPQNAYFTLIGPNGAGKSVLIRTMMGILAPTQGKVELFGQALKKNHAAWFGYVPQLKTFDVSFPATVGEFILSGRDQRWPFRITEDDQNKILEVLRSVKAERLFERSLSLLSGGELQRAYLARALIRHPRILILDEPSTGIDMEGEEDLYKLLDEIRARQQTTIVMVTHDQTVAEHHSSHVLLLNQRVIAFGSPTQALTETSLKKAFGHHAHHHEMPTRLP